MLPLRIDIQVRRLLAFLLQEVRFDFHQGLQATETLSLEKVLMVLTLAGVQHTDCIDPR